MIQTHLFSVQIHWMTFMRILMTKIQAEKVKPLIMFDNMIADIITNKNVQAIIKNCLLDAENHTILFFCSKSCQIKFNSLRDHENKQQEKITKYCNKSFCRY